MDNQELGKKGEEIAANFLKEKGFVILHQNWRFGSDEIDIIAQKNKTISIVEVKTRKNTYFGNPYEAVNKAKQGFLVRAANAFVTKYNINHEIQFDIISIVHSPSVTDIEYIENAFYPKLK